MKKLICPDCKKPMSFDTEDGILTCGACGKSIPVTDFEHHEFGSTANSQYIRQYAGRNKDMHTDGIIPQDIETRPMHTTDSAVYYVPFELDADAIKKILFKNPLRKLLFSRAFNKIIKTRKFEKIYIPIWSNEVIANASINASCMEFDGKNTNYYDVEKHAQLLFEQFNTTATTMHGSIHIDSLFPYNIGKAVPAVNVDALKKNGEKIIEADIPPDRYMDNIKTYADKSAHSKLNSLISSYASAHNKVYDGSSYVTMSKLIYLPVWGIPHSAGNLSDYLYINGQTGRSDSNPPLGKLKTKALFLLICLAMSAILVLAAYFAGI